MKLFSKKITPFIVILAFILILVLLNIFQKETRNFFYSIFSPIQKYLWTTGSNFYEFLGGNLKKENSELRVKNQELVNQLSLLEELKKDNEELRTALELNLNKDFKLVFAEIIAKDISENSILIDKGSEDGISKDMPVINGQRVIFGRISEVYNNFSRIVMITAKNFTFDVKVQNKEIYGVVRGERAMNIRLDLVPRDSELQEGDVLTTSSLEGVFPKNLLVGTVGEIKKEDTKFFQTAEIKPFLDIKSVENLFIITNFKR